MSLDLSSTNLDLIKAVNDALGNKLSLSGGTLTGALTTKDLTLKGIEQFQTHYAKKLIGTLSAGTSYANLDSNYKDGTYHRMWRLRFPASCNFWGKIKITLYGGYSSFNASGIMSKSITCNFNGSSIYNNVGFYDGLGVNVEKDFRISEAIWNSTASAWEILIWQKNLSGNNSPTILIEAWSSSETHLTNAKNITAQAVELTQATTYTASKASSTGGTKTVTWATTPVYETPLGEEIATMSDIPSVPSVTVTQKLTSGTEIGSIKVGSTTTKLYAPTGSGSVSGNYLPLSGGTMTGDILFDINKNDSYTIGDEELSYIRFSGGYGDLRLSARGTFSVYGGDYNSLSIDNLGITLSAKSGGISATAPTNVSGQENVTAWFNTANGGRVGFGKEATNSGTGIFFDQVKGTRRLNFCASSTAGEMVWEQPEANSGLYFDVNNVFFREANNVQFTKLQSAGYLYTDSSGYLKKGTLATQSAAGLMSAADKTKLDGIGANTIKSLSASGTTITYTKGDGTKGTITTQDTKVTQKGTSTSSPCMLALLSNNNGSEVADYVYANIGIFAIPATGALYATSFYENGTALSSKYALKSSVSTYTLPLAASGTRGGIKIGYTASGANIPLRLSSEKGYVALTKSAVISAIGNGTATSLYNGLPTAGSNFTVTNISSYRYLIIGIIDKNNNYIVNMLPTNYVKTLNSSSKKICVADDTSYATFWYVSNTSFRLNSIYSYVTKVVVLGVN